MTLIIIFFIILLLAFAAKVVWDTAEIHELHKMRAGFDRRLEEIKIDYPELVGGLQEAETLIDLELEHESTLLERIEEHMKV